MARKSPLHVSQLLSWADAHHKRTGKWPDVSSGHVEEAPEEKWCNIDCNLRYGGRGLPRGWSLARLLAEFRGRRNPAAWPPHTLEQILAWADAFHDRTGKWPMGTSGAIEDANGEDWGAVDMALHAGSRGLPPGNTLARLLREQRGVQRKRRRKNAPRHARESAPVVVEGATTRELESRAEAMRRQIARRRQGRNVHNLPLFTIDKILAWADAYHARHAAWPNRRAGLIDGTLGETWTAVDIALSRGLRGLPSGSSLPRLLCEHRGVFNAHDQPPLSVEQVVAWADAHHARKGEWPMVDSGPILESSHETWCWVNHALRAGRRGLPGRTSLARLLDEHRGTHKASDPKPLTLRRILAWADAYRRRVGKWPSTRSGPVAESPDDSWQAIELSLRHGLRGLKGGSSLARLLAERRGKRNRASLPTLSESQILAWADTYFARHGKWPTQKSGPIEDAPGETWGGINDCLESGRRGLPGGASLAGLLNRHRRGKAVGGQAPAAAFAAATAETGEDGGDAAFGLPTFRVHDSAARVEGYALLKR